MYHLRVIPLLVKYIFRHATRLSAYILVLVANVLSQAGVMLLHHTTYSFINYGDVLFPARPTSLMTIRQNVEKNVIRTTEEFTRDMMLMFVNALMYNNHEYDVYAMAQEMCADTLKAIEVCLIGFTLYVHISCS